MLPQRLKLVRKRAKPTPWLRSPVCANPNPMETVTIYRAQSILTFNGQRGPVLSYEQALDVVRWAERGNNGTC